MTSRGVNRAVMKQLVRLYRESRLGMRLPAYDGRKSLYTAGPLPFVSSEFRITLIDEDDGSGMQRFTSSCLLLNFPIFFPNSSFFYYNLFLCILLQEREGIQSRDKIGCKG